MPKDNDKQKLIDIDSTFISYDQNNQNDSRIIIDSKTDQRHTLRKSIKYTTILGFVPLIYVVFNIILLFRLSDQRLFNYFGILNSYLFFFYALRGVISLKTKIQLIFFIVNIISIVLFALVLIFFLINISFCDSKKLFLVYVGLCALICLCILFLKATYQIGVKYQRVSSCILVFITFLSFYALFYLYDCYLCNLFYFFSILIDLLLEHQERKHLKMCLFFYDEIFITFTCMLCFFIMSFSGLVTPTWLDQMLIKN